MLNLIKKKNIINSIVSIIILFLFLLLIEFLNVRHIDFKYIEILLFCSVVVYIVSFLYTSQKQYYKNFILIFLFFISIFFIKIFENSIFDHNSIKYLIALTLDISLAFIFNKYIIYLFDIIFYFEFLIINN